MDKQSFLTNVLPANNMPHKYDTAPRRPAKPTRNPRQFKREDGFAPSNLAELLGMTSIKVNNK